MNLMWLQLESNIHVLSKERVFHKSWLVFHKSAVANGGRQNEHSWAPAFEFRCLEKRVCCRVKPWLLHIHQKSRTMDCAFSYSLFRRTVNTDLAHPVLARLASLLVQAISTMAQQSNSQKCKYDHCHRHQKIRDTLARTYQWNAQRCKLLCATVHIPHVQTKTFRSIKI